MSGIVKIAARFSDLNIFVEDNTSVNYYKIYVSRLLTEGVKSVRILQCEGRQGVIKAAKDERFNRLPSIFFLIDGDIYVLCGEKYQIPQNVFVLDSYCIENLFYCLDAAIQMAFECEPEDSLGKLRRRLSLKKWHMSVVKILFPLFLWYATAMKLGAQLKTTSVSGLAFLRSGACDLDEDLVRAKSPLGKGRQVSPGAVNKPEI